MENQLLNGTARLDLAEPAKSHGLHHRVIQQPVQQVLQCANASVDVSHLPLPFSVRWPNVPYRLATFYAERLTFSVCRMQSATYSISFSAERCPSDYFGHRRMYKAARHGK